jgi:hypothetical protein
MNEDIISIIEKYVILLLGVGNRPVPSMWHVEKELFILSKSNSKIQKFFEFEKHYNGPYSQVLKEVVEEPLYFADAFALNEKGLYLTPSGKKIFNRLLEENKLDKKFTELVSALKLIRSLYDELSVEELLFVVYITYPEYTKFSNISDKVLKNKEKRKQLSKNLLRKRLITEKRYKELIV